MDDKRKFTRLVQVMPARHRPSQGTVIEPASVKDISVGGVRLSSAADLAAGTSVDVEVAIPNSSEPYYMRGEVVWRRDNNPAENKNFDLGIRFVRVLSKTEHQGF